jgi:two-component system response regulator TctD
MKILLIEDTTELGDAIATRLRADGHELERAENGDIALKHFGEDRYDLIVLDLDLTESNGIYLLKALRRRRIVTPVLVITALTEIEDKVNLLDFGADDCLVKPFDLRELEARIRVLLRRGAGMSASKAEFGNVVMDLAARSVAIEGNEIALSRREFRLFELLISRLGQVVPKERLMDQLFGFEGEASPNALELYVSRIRQKLRDSTLRIETVRCVGYVAKSYDRPA